MVEIISVNVIVGKDGRVTIPVKLRDEHDIKEGDILKFVSNGTGHVIEVNVIK